MVHTKMGVSRRPSRADLEVGGGNTSVASESVLDLTGRSVSDNSTTSWYSTSPSKNPKQEKEKYTWAKLWDEVSIPIPDLGIFLVCIGPWGILAFLVLLLSRICLVGSCGRIEPEDRHKWTLLILAFILFLYKDIIDERWAVFAKLFCDKTQFPVLCKKQ